MKLNEERMKAVQENDLVKRELVSSILCLAKFSRIFILSSGLV